MKQKYYYATVEGFVTRVVRVEATNVAEAIKEAKREFTSLVGAQSAHVIKINQETTND